MGRGKLWAGSQGARGRAEEGGQGAEEIGPGLRAKAGGDGENAFQRGRVCD